MRAKLWAPPLVLLGSGLAALAWGVLVEPRRLDVREETGGVPGLPSSWEGQRVALLADFQVGAPLSNVGTVRQAVQRVVEARPAVALLAGDYVYRLARDPDGIADRAAELLAPLPGAGIPTYAVLGNHDYGDVPRWQKWRRRRLARGVRQSLEDAGIRVLVDEAVPLPPPAPGQNGEPPLYLVGLAPKQRGTVRPSAALEHLPDGAPRIVLMHDPLALGRLPPGAAPLALAGHTHGGQIRAPFRPDWTLARLRKPWPEYEDGWVPGVGAPGNHLYVNRGLGFSLLPIRFGCPPELTLLRLRGEGTDTRPWRCPHPVRAVRRTLRS